jgi:activating signal cointegrator 1
MLALSLWEPHATAIAERIKRYETRGWNLLPRYIGVPVAIHAAKKVFRERDYPWEYFKEVRDRLHAVGVPLHRLSYGRIVCVVTFTASGPTSIIRQAGGDLFWGDFRDVGDDGRDRYAFTIDDVRKIPVNRRTVVTGRQGFFHIPEDLALAVCA